MVWLSYLYLYLANSYWHCDFIAFWASHYFALIMFDDSKVQRIESCESLWIYYREVIKTCWLASSGVIGNSSVDPGRWTAFLGSEEWWQVSHYQTCGFKPQLLSTVLKVELLRFYFITLSSIRNFISSHFDDIMNLCGISNLVVN